ncbi:MAG: flagellar hook-associated protein FlgL [Bacillota bacterium]|jgi:flagellar hook-associated protein 3 FlgL
MRVTEERRMANWLREAEFAARRLERAEMAVASGKSLLELSDNPIDVGKVIMLKEQINREEQFISSINESIAWLKTSENTLATVSDVLMKAQEMAYIGANDTITDDMRRSLAEQIDPLVDYVLDLANSKHAGQYLFGGEKTDIQPFKKNNSGTGVEYQGGTDFIFRQVQQGGKISISNSGQKVFLDSGVFDSLFSLKEGLQSGDRELVANSIQGLGDAFKNIATQRALVGSNINRMENAKEHHDLQKYYFQTTIGEIEEKSLIETITLLKNEELAYQATLAVGARIGQISLLNYLK